MGHDLGHLHRCPDLLSGSACLRRRVPVTGYGVLQTTTPRRSSARADGRRVVHVLVTFIMTLVVR